MLINSADSEMEQSLDDTARKPHTELVLHALNLYRAADAAMRRRVRETIGVGESDLLALRFLLRSQLEGRAIAPKDISEYLGISSPSTTAMLDRLARAGRLRREMSPTDRRALIIVPTISNEDEIRSMLGEVQPAMLKVVSALDATSAETIINFLDEMQSAVDSVRP